MATPSCSTCQHSKPGQSGALAGHGFALCAKGTRWTYYPVQLHSCQKHTNKKERG